MALTSKPGELVVEDSILKKAGLDRLRLLLIYYLTSEKVDEANIDELVRLFTAAYPEQSLASLNYVRSRVKERRMQKESQGGFSQVFTSKRA